MEKHIDHGAPTECPNCKNTKLEEDSDYSGTEWSWYCIKCDWLGKAEAHSITVSLGDVWTHTRGKKMPQPRYTDPGPMLPGFA